MLPVELLKLLAPTKVMKTFFFFFLIKGIQKQKFFVCPCSMKILVCCAFFGSVQLRIFGGGG